LALLILLFIAASSIIEVRRMHIRYDQINARSYTEELNHIGDSEVE
jgi:hypothetical protein